jgi:hypothetical protein
MVRAGFCRTCCPAGADWARKKPVKASTEPLFIFEPFVTIGKRYGFIPATNRELSITDQELGSSEVQGPGSARDQEPLLAFQFSFAELRTDQSELRRSGRREITRLRRSAVSLLRVYIAIFI